MSEHIVQPYSPLNFVAMPVLPRLAPTVLNHTIKNKAKSATKPRTWWWLWMIPIAHFAIGSLLSLNVAMADSVLPMMAEQNAHDNVRVIHELLQPDLVETSHQAEVIESEQWMNASPQASADLSKEAIRASSAQYTPLLTPDATSVQSALKIKTAVPKSVREDSSWFKARHRKHVDAARANPFVLKKPLFHMQASSPFGRRAGRLHQGLDLASPTGSPIMASASGTVIFSGRQGSYGLLVMVDHGHGLITKYAHCSKSVVTLGQHVEAGETIALVGQTGRATGPHLHFEVVQAGEAKNPEPYLEASV